MKKTIKEFLKQRDGLQRDLQEVDLSIGDIQYEMAHESNPTELKWLEREKRALQRERNIITNLME